MSQKKAIFCKNIITSEESTIISGYVLIEGEKIEDIVEEKRIGPEKLAEIKRKYQLTDCGDSYLIPGLIDINTHLCETFDEDWQDPLNTTKMAAQGGITTIVDNPQFNKYNSRFDERTCLKNRLHALKGNLFVDCGILALAGPNNCKNLDSIMEIPEVLGFRAYMAPSHQNNLPYWEEKQVKRLAKGIERSKHDIILSVHCESASARDLFLSSPCRTVDIAKRLDSDYDIMDQRAFGGGHHGNIESESDSNYSEGESEEDEFEYKPLPATSNQNEPQSPTSSILRNKANKVAKSQEEKYVSKLELMEYNHEEEGNNDLNKNKEGESLETKLKQEEGDDPINIDDDDSQIGSPTNFMSGESPLLGQSPMILGASPLVFQFPSPKGSNEDIKLAKTPEKNEIKLISTPPNYKRQPPNASRFSGLVHINEELSSPERVAVEDNKSKNNEDFNTELDDFLKEQEKLQSQKDLERIEKSASDIKGGGLKLDLSRRQSRLLVRRTSAMNAPDMSPELKGSPIFMGINTKKEEQARRDAEKNKKYFCFLPNRPISWETNGIHFIMKFFKNNKNGSVVLTNLSSASLAFKIRQVKKHHSNLRIYVDTAIPFLYFYSKIIGTGETIFKSSPPIRDKEERDLLLRMLRINGLDSLSSFHIQTPFKYKNIENGNFRRAFDGLSNIGYNLQVVWTKLYLIEKKKLKKQGTFSPAAIKLDKLMNVLVKTLSSNPAKIFNLQGRKGTLEKGKDADFVVWDPFKINAVRNVDIHLKHKKSFIYRDHRFYGEVKMTFLRGDLIYRNNDGNKDFIQKGVVLQRPS